MASKVWNWMANEKITIKMVSEKAKVSKTTVSRYLNGKYEFMSADTKKRIEEVIEDLDYRPNAMAQGLKNNKTGLIGLVIADITNPFSAILIKGVNDACVKKSFQVVIIDTNNDPEKERESIQTLIQRQVEGIIINTTGNNDDFIHTLPQQGIKIVLADRPIENNNIDTVTTDYEKATSEMMKKVYDEGFERIGFLSRSLREESVKRKHDYFFETTANLVKSTRSLTYTIDEKFPLFKECQDLLREFLNAHKGNNLAMFAESSIVLINLINAIHSLGLKIPDDIGVCGYDELGLTNMSDDGISVISKPSYYIGLTAAELLLKRIVKNKEQYKSKYIELLPEINIKSSTQIVNNSFDKMVIKVTQEHKRYKS